MPSISARVTTDYVNGYSIA